MKAIFKYFKHFRLCLDVLLILALLMILFLPWQNWFDDGVKLSRAALGVSWEHPLGTDALGRDQWLRAINSLRETLPWLWMGVFLGVSSGLSLGVLRLASSMRPSIQQICRFWESIALFLHGVPLPIAAFFLMVVTHAQGLLSFVICLTALMLLRSYFFVTSNYQRSKLLGYWQAHEAMGGLRLGRIWKYGIFGHWRSELFLAIAFFMKVAVITEISLSYLGFGVQEPRASFGNLLSNQLRQFFDGEWSLLIGALALISLACEAPFCLYRWLNVWPAVLRGQRPFPLPGEKSSGLRTDPSHGRP
ncbi:MAG: hypothetical protein ACOH5I_14995 [Oligoflexus sp.]